MKAVPASALTQSAPDRLNNDGYGVFPDLGLYVVVDGMGGGWRSDEAAHLVVETLRDAYESGERSALGLALAVQAANRALFGMQARDPRWTGVGAAIAALAVVDSIGHIAHVGDCRVHRLRGRALERLTEDHSLRNEYLRTHDLSPEQIEQLPANVITRALGMSDSVQVDTRTEALEEGDRFLLTSDGLHASVGEARMAELVLSQRDGQAAVHALLGAARKAGGQDDLTAVLVTFSSSG